MSSTMRWGVLGVCVVVPIFAASSAEGAKHKLSRRQLERATTLVVDAFPAPYEKTYAAVVTRLGPPHRRAHGLREWFAVHRGKCLQFFLTKAPDGGHASSGLAEIDAKNCREK